MKIKKLLITAAGVILPLLSAAPAFAASATMSLSSAGSVSKGSNITVSIRENSGSEPVNAARATLSYPTSLLQFVSIGSSSAFGIVAANSGGGGTVNVDRGALPAVSGSQTVATVTFKALTDSGAAAVNITGGQVISANSNSDISGAKTGTNIALKAAAAPTPATPAAAKDTIPPTITKVSVSDITPVSAVLNWTTSEPSTSEVNYGPAKNYGLAAVETTAGTVHKLTLNSPLVQPGITYHYSIKATDTSGNAASSPDATFTTKGAQLLLSVKNQKDKPLSGAKVDVEGHSATTDKNGVATVDGLTLGKKYGVITYQGSKSSFSADIASADKPNTASAKMTVKPNYTVPVILFVLILLAIDYFIGWKTGRGGFGAKFASKISSRLPIGDSSKLPPPDNKPPSGSGSGTIVRPGGKA